MKKVFAILLSVVLMISILPVSALAVDIIDSGRCGANVTWTLDENGKLTISGRNRMYDYELAEDVPWYEHIEAIKTVVIESGVTSIGENVFTRCIKMTSVTLPDTVTSIGDFAFYGCEKLPEINLPDSIKTIGETVFYECNSLTEVTIPDGVTAIEAWTFGWTENITTVNIPDSVTRIEELAFYRCKSLTEIVIPDGVTAIKHSTFSSCESLVSVTIPDSVTTIETEAFAGCESLVEITIPEGITSIGNYAFAWCDSLTSFEIPASVIDIIDYAFYGCESMEEYIVDKDNMFYSNDEHGVLFNKDKSVLIQAPVSGIRGSYTIPDGVRSITHFAFDCCENITEITIPASVVEAGSYVDCNSLTRFIVSADNRNYSNDESGALYNKDKSELICVPGGIYGVFTVPASVTTLNRFAFTENDYIYAIEFTGDAPIFDGDYLLYRYVTGYYPENNATWTAEARESYGPMITWVAYTPFIAGDVDGNGSVSNTDLVLTARYIVRLCDAETAAEVERYADLNDDGMITNTDLVMIARIIVD